MFASVADDKLTLRRRHASCFPKKSFSAHESPVEGSTQDHGPDLGPDFSLLNARFGTAQILDFLSESRKPG